MNWAVSQCLRRAVQPTGHLHQKSSPEGLDGEKLMEQGSILTLAAGTGIAMKAVCPVVSLCVFLS